jgi:ABC-2 type transport system permease protein
MLGRTMRALLEADLIVQIRNRRALLLSMVLPLVLLFGLSAGRRADIFGDPLSRVASCLTLGMTSIAVLGYSMTIARDRERGVFERLLVTPTPPWAIMLSRLIVQVIAMLTMAIVTLVVAGVFLGVSLSPQALGLTLLAVVFGSAVYLSVGQALVGLVRSADTVNAVGRLVYIPLFALGLLGHVDILGTTVETIARWSPGGAVAGVLSASMHPSTWSSDTWWATLASVTYAVVFAGVGIRWFQWRPER